MPKSEIEPQCKLGKCRHGLGVIAKSPIEKKQRVHLWRAGDWKIWNPRTFEKLKWCNKWCIYAWDKFYGPADPENKSLAWYVNHSSAPNVECSYDRRGNWKFIALKNIRTGEELTVNYSTLDYYGK